MQEVSRSYDQADENARQVVRRTRNVRELSICVLKPLDFWAAI